MNPNSRDNVNVDATVTCTAYDRNGDIVDQDKYHGRHEPATRFLDFMLNCEAMFGKHGNKIIRFTCEVAYVLAALVFLSSQPVEAARGSYADVLRSNCGDHNGSLPCSSRVLSSGDVYWTDNKSGRVRVLRTRPASQPFASTHAPVPYVKELHDWPPYPRDYVLNEAQSIARKAWEHVQKVIHKPDTEAKQGTPWWHPALFIIGLVVLVAGLTFQRWRVLAKI